MRNYQYHIFVCLGKRCAERGSEELLDLLKEEVKARGLKEKVIVSRSGCVKLCKETETEGEYSPVVLVYPEGVWYKNVDKAGIIEIIEKHLTGGEVVEKSLYYNLKERS